MTEAEILASRPPGSLCRGESLIRQQDGTMTLVRLWVERGQQRAECLGVPRPLNLPAPPPNMRMR
jgi:hypothetical protein